MHPTLPPATDHSSATAPEDRAGAGKDTHDHLTTLLGAWRNGRWTPDLPARALALAVAAPRLEHRLLSLEIEQVLVGIDDARLRALTGLLKLDALPHPALGRRVAAIALQFGDEARALAELDRTQALLGRAPVARLARRLRSGSLWSLTACPALLAFVARERDGWLSARERTMADTAHWLMSALQPESPAPRLPTTPAGQDDVHAIRSNRPRLAIVGSGLAAASVDSATSASRPVAGARIDAADVVVRFDDTGVSPARCTILGMRTDLWVLSRAAMPKIAEPAGGTVLVTDPGFAYRPQAHWSTLRETNTRRIHAASSVLFRQLWQQLGAVPGPALIALATLIELAPDARIDLIDDGVSSTIERERGSLRTTDPDKAGLREATRRERDLLGELLTRRAS